ncbi:MAG: FeoC-like transcriptional regulator [Anaerolineae bacterium]
MLEELLRRIAEGGTYNLSELARELGVSEELLRQMIEDLVQRGYLRPVAGDCQGRCAACPLAETCAIGGPTRVWALTEKGRLRDART